MTSSVTFSAAVGGDGSTVTDGSDASTGLANGGHRTRLVPAMAQVIAVAQRAVDKAAESAASAASAVLAPGSSGTSTSSITIGAGAKTFVTQAGKNWVVGQPVVVADSANPATNAMYGIITAYAGTGITVQVSNYIGSGTIASWVIALTGAFSTPAAQIYNAIIAGEFSTNPWQRGASFATIADGTYTADRWLYNKTGAMVHTVSQSVSGPTPAQAGIYASNCLLVDCTTVDSAIAAGDYCIVGTKILGLDFLPLAQNTMTLSFWHCHTKTGTYCAALRNSGRDRSFVVEYTQAVSDTWELATATIPATPTAGSWDYANGVGIEVSFCLVGGSTFQVAAGSWQVGNFMCSANQVNASDNVANNFRITLVQLQPGAVATAYHGRSAVEVRRHCEFFYREFLADSIGDYFAAGTLTTTTSASFVLTFPAMRVTPTTTTTTVGSFTVENQANLDACTVLSPSNASLTTLRLLAHL